VTKIPRRFHFVFGLRPQTSPFHIVHYLCLKSCIDVERPESVHLHCHYEPFGELWDRIRPALTVHRIEQDAWVRDHPSYFTHEEGRLIQGLNLGYAHQSDFVRLRVLLEHGGVYADMDTLFVQPVPAARFDEAFVIGEERLASVTERPHRRTLCNAFLMSARGAAFPKVWLSRMREVFDGTWSRHSCEEATALRERMPESVWVAPVRNHFLHPCTPEGIHTLLVGLDPDLSEVYSMHLWAHVWWSPLRTDFTTVHAGMLTEDHIRTVDTTYTVVARRFLDPA
jgi:hypothetical protein